MSLDEDAKSELLGALVHATIHTLFSADDRAETNCPPRGADTTGMDWLSGSARITH